MCSPLKVRLAAVHKAACAASASATIELQQRMASMLSIITRSWHVQQRQDARQPVQQAGSMPETCVSSLLAEFCWPFS